MCNQEIAKEMIDLIISDSSIKEFSFPVDENEWHYDIEHNCYRKKIPKDEVKQSIKRIVNNSIYGATNI